MHLVVDGNSTDGTSDIVRKKMKHYTTLYLLSKEGRGLGAAYVSGMKYAMQRLQADAVIEMDADFQHDPRYVRDFVSAFVTGADYVLGSRFINGGSIPTEWMVHRRLVSRFGNRILKSVLRLPNVQDYTTGFRLTRVKGILGRIDLDTLTAKRRFAYKLDLLCRTMHLSRKTVEIPIHFHARTREASKSSLMEIAATIAVALRIGINKFLTEGYKFKS